MVDHTELFGMGYSWGGYESLLIPGAPETCRTPTLWRRTGRCYGFMSGWKTRAT
jgi:cystathionine beta-lyase